VDLSPRKSIGKGRRIVWEDWSEHKEASTAHGTADVISILRGPQVRIRSRSGWNTFLERALGIKKELYTSLVYDSLILVKTSLFFIYDPISLTL
jgi:hypothetical protein